MDGGAERKAARRAESASGVGAAGPGSSPAAGLAEVAALEVSDDVGATLRRIAECASAYVPGCDEVGVTLLRDGRLETGAWLGPAVCGIDAAQYDAGEGPCVETVRSGRPHRVADTAAEARWPAFAAAARDRGVRAVLSLPLVVRAETLGALNLYARSAGAFAGGPDQLAGAFAAQAAVVLANARAYAAAREAAVALQRHLLPERLAAPAGFALAVRYRPAAGDDVGGDWYDAVALGDGALALSVGDVGGHGLRAAAVMGQARAALRAYVLEGHEPAAALGLVHRFLPGVERDAFATACCAVVGGRDASGRVLLRWASAGHPPPLVLGPAGGARYLSGEPNVVLGAPLSTPFRGQRTGLEAGSVLVFCTDGLVERRDRPLDEGLARLADAAAGAGPPGDVEALCDRVLGALAGDGEGEDDVALLAVRVPGGA